MRILIFTTAYLPHIGGAEIALSEITSRLPESTFVVVTARFDRSLSSYEKKGNVTVYRIGWGTIFDKFWLALRGARVAEHFFSEKPDLVWAMMASYGGLAALSYKKKNPATPYLLSLQEGDDVGRVRRRTFFVQKHFQDIFKKADHIQVISEYLKTWAHTYAREVPVTVIPNGVDLSQVSYRFREMGQSIHLISLSRLVWKNGMDTLLEALALLPERFSLTLVGDGPLRSRLERLASRLGISGRVTFTGSLSPGEALGLLDKADVFVRPSRTEGLGNAFLEAMAAGLPTLGTPVGGIVDFLSEGKTGWLVPPANPEALAKKIESLVALPREERKIIAENARALVENNFSWNTVALRVGELFQKVNT